MSIEAITKTILSLEENYKQPLFLGQTGLSFQRFDKYHHQVFYKSFRNQLDFFWRPEEVNLTKDIADFKELLHYEQEIFTSNLRYQIVLDSVQSRGIPYLCKHVTNGELEYAMKVWEFMETLHSYSYTYIIQNINQQKMLDNLLAEPEILNRAKSVTTRYNELIGIDQKPTNEKDLKRKLYLTLVDVYILEGIRFYVSFACSYAFAQNKRMEGNAKIIKLINRDENLHLALGQAILKRLRQDEREGFIEIVRECEDTVYSFFEEAINSESSWCEYVFRNGSLLGLTEDALKSYLKWLTARRMKAIGLKPISAPSSNPLSWMEAWTDSSKVQHAPQETEIDSYKKGSFVDDFDTTFTKAKDYWR